MSHGTFDGLRVDYIQFYVSDVAAATAWLAEGYGFAVCAASCDEGAADYRSVALVKNRIRLVLTEPLSSRHRGAEYLDKHGDGVADIALWAPDPAAAFEAAVRRGARLVLPPVERHGITTATVGGFGDVTHTFISRSAGSDDHAFPGMRPGGLSVPSTDTGLIDVDHFAVCVGPGQIDSTVAFYVNIFDFELIFAERIIVGSQAIVTKVVQSRSGAVTLTLIEPDTSGDHGHIEDFLDNHGGPGVQHIAFTSADIVKSVEAISSAGVAFLGTPGTYYDLLSRRLNLARHSVGTLRRHNILVDEDHHGQLFQIFTKSVHPRDTLFLEVIERVGARSFGSGNIKALYEAVELQRSESGVPG